MLSFPSDWVNCELINHMVIIKFNLSMQEVFTFLQGVIIHLGERMIYAK